jgi:hypothetical protein
VVFSRIASCIAVPARAHHGSLVTSLYVALYLLRTTSRSDCHIGARISRFRIPVANSHVFTDSRTESSVIRPGLNWDGFS